MRMLLCSVALVTTLAGCSREQLERSLQIDDCRNEAERKGRYVATYLDTGVYVYFDIYEWTRASEAYFASCVAALPPPRPNPHRSIGERYAVRAQEPLRNPVMRP